MGLNSSADLITQEVKKIRLRISDFYRNPVLEPMLLKLWRLLLEVQFEKILLNAVQNRTHIPLAIEVYEQVMPVFEVALGVYY